jgi:hypothetical protein
MLVGEIQRNCDFALLAHKDMIKYLQSMKQDDKEALDRFWSSVQSFLITVANISKILWPSSGLSTEVSSRREALRGLLSVDDSSPIRSKTFRNHFEHYDTRIEDWAKEYENKTIIDSNIGPVDSVIIGVNNAVSIMRNFDPYKFIVRLRDQEYDINRVVTAVQNLLNKTKAIQK